MEDQHVARASVIEIRPGRDADLPFIFSTWLKGLKHGNDWFDLIDGKIYFTQYHKIIEAILLDPFTTIRVCCDPKDQDVVRAYSVTNGKKLHWVHVKKRWRGIGIAKSLVPSDIKTVTHVTKPGRSWLQSHKDVQFNPFQIP